MILTTHTLYYVYVDVSIGLHEKAGGYIGSPPFFSPATEYQGVAGALHGNDKHALRGLNG